MQTTFLNWRLGMTEFKSWQDYFIFQSEVRSRYRHIFPTHVKEFLESVKVTCNSRSRQVPKGTIYWRAQRGNGWQRVQEDDVTSYEVEAPYPPERMKPVNGGAREGRANAKGIPCLYLATDKDTAMAEVRPWIGSYISVGQFKTTIDLKLVDLTEHRKLLFYLEEPGALERESAVWGEIDSAFSEPVTNDESSADYAPTQVLSELFRDHGYDGIIYKSMLDEKGFNVALFDLNSAELINCSLYKVEKVAFKFNEYTNPYYINRSGEG